MEGTPEGAPETDGALESEGTVEGAKDGDTEGAIVGA